MADRPNIYQEVTECIVAAIEAGAPKFEMPWHRMGRPANAKTGQPYRGVNTVSLWASQQIRGFDSDIWATYRQWQELDAQVRKGEKASPVVFYKECRREVRNKQTGVVEEETYLVVRASRVFNADQVDGWEPPPTPEYEVKAIEQAEAFIQATAADIRHGSDQAYYRIDADYIGIPERECFTGSSSSTPTEAYYATLLHELTHWTGHPNRLDRLSAFRRFGATAYGREELVAELGAAFLCAELSITNTPRADHAAYIATWLSILKSDTKAIFSAAAKANEAVTYLRKLRLAALPAIEAQNAEAGRAAGGIAQRR